MPLARAAALGTGVDAMIRRAGISLAVALAVLFAAAGMAMLYRFDPSSNPGYFPKCRFYEVTGLRCAGCGATRATHHLLHGNLGSAFYYNSLFVMALPVSAWFVAQHFWRRWRNRPPTPRIWRRHAWTAGVAIMLVLVFSVVRNLPGWPLL